MPDNPFEVLRLDPATSVEEAIRLADRLAQETTDEPLRQRLRQAAQQLAISPDRAALAALLTPPAPAYSSETLHEFLVRHGSPPTGTPSAALPALDEDEFRRRLLETIAGELSPGVAELEPLEITEGGAEIARQTAEAMWQALLSDTRA
jgi:hypothetical protein